VGAALRHVNGADRNAHAFGYGPAAREGRGAFGGGVDESKRWAAAAFRWVRGWSRSATGQMRRTKALAAFPTMGC